MTRPRTNLNTVNRNPMFAKRLLEACERNPDVPPFGMGQQKWVKDKVGNISSEGVRKWFSGEAKPRGQAMRTLAAALGVDEAWLALGHSPDLDPKARKARNAMADGAVNLVAGLVQMSGASPAFPTESDPRAAYVDLYAIVKGVQYAFNVSLAIEIRPGVYRFPVVNEYEDCTTIGLISDGPMNFALLHLTHDVIAAHSVAKGGSRELVVTAAVGAEGDRHQLAALSFSVEGWVIQQIRGFDNRL